MSDVFKGPNNSLDIRLVCEPWLAFQDSGRPLNPVKHKVQGGPISLRSRIEKDEMSLLDLSGRVRRASFLKNESEPLESSSFATYLLQEEVTLPILIMGCGIHQTFHHLPKWKVEGAQQEREHRVRVPRNRH